MELKEVRQMDYLLRDWSDLIQLKLFAIEGKLNEYNFIKGHKRRFIVRDNYNIVTVTLNNNGLKFDQAIYLVNERKLYMISGCSPLHWAAIRRVFKDTFENIELIGH